MHWLVIDIVAFVLVGMNTSDFLVVRFHFNGVFVRDGMKILYVEGREEISHVGLRSLSLSTLIAN